MQKYSRVFWAPSLRYHNNRYYIYVCTPEEGLFMWHAENPRGPWSNTFCVKEANRWEDPCPFWDDNGNAYLVQSVLGAGPLILHRMTPDGTRLLDDGREIYYETGGMGPEIKGDCVWLRTEYVDEICRFYYSLDGKNYSSVPVKFRMKFAGWKACRMGLYSFGSESGHADFDYFRFVYGPTLQMCR